VWLFHICARSALFSPVRFGFFRLYEFIFFSRRFSTSGYFSLPLSYFSFCGPAMLRPCPFVLLEWKGNRRDRRAHSFSSWGFPPLPRSRIYSTLPPLGDQSSSFSIRARSWRCCRIFPDLSLPRFLFLGAHRRGVHTFRTLLDMRAFSAE